MNQDAIKETNGTSGVAPRAERPWHLLQQKLQSVSI